MDPSIPTVCIELSQDTFHDSVFNDSLNELEHGWFVKFYAPWCTHCQRLAPVWEEFAVHHSDEVNVGAVDCTKYGSLCNEFGVRGYPTLIFFPTERPGDALHYNGNRDVDSFVDFVEENKRPY